MSILILFLYFLWFSFLPAFYKQTTTFSSSISLLHFRNLGAPYSSSICAVLFATYSLFHYHQAIERKTVFPIDALDMSKLSLFDEDRPLPLTNGIEALDCSEAAPSRPRSVSKRSSDRSGTRLRCCSVGESAIVGRAQL
nr:uncharacterized protein LOC109191297 [Ipomoea batatas]